MILEQIIMNWTRSNSFRWIFSECTFYASSWSLEIWTAMLIDFRYYHCNVKLNFLFTLLTRAFLHGNFILFYFFLFWKTKRSQLWDYFTFAMVFFFGFPIEGFFPHCLKILTRRNFLVYTLKLFDLFRVVSWDVWMLFFCSYLIFDAL